MVVQKVSEIDFLTLKQEFDGYWHLHQIHDDS